MTTPTAAIPTAQKRRTKTRTRRVSARPALAVSTLCPNQIDLRPGAMCLVCPDCGTWCPITGHQSTTPKLVPHHAGRAYIDEARRCVGSNRRVTLDLTIAAWWQRLADAERDAASRRSSRVLREPETPPAPPVTRLDPAPPTADTARQAYIAHREHCTKCTGFAQHCKDGERLGAHFLRLLRREPRQRRNRALLAQLQYEIERSRARQFPRQRAAEWAAVLPAVKRADAKRALHPAGDAPTKGPDVPLEPLRQVGPVSLITAGKGDHR